MEKDQFSRPIPEKMPSMSSLPLTTQSKLDREREKKEKERDKEVEKEIEKLEKDRVNDKETVINKTIHLLQHYSHQFGSSTSNLTTANREQRSRLHELFTQIEKEFEILWEENQELRKRLDSQNRSVQSTGTYHSRKDGSGLGSRLNPLKKKDRQCQKLTQFLGHRDGIWEISTCKWEKQQFATASVDRTARIWDASGSQVYLFQGHKGSVNSVRFHPNSRLLCTASGDGTCHVWRVPKPEDKQQQLRPEKLGESPHHPSTSPHPWTPLLNRTDNTTQNENSLNIPTVSGTIGNSGGISSENEEADQLHRSASLSVVTISKAALELKHKGVVIAADWISSGDKLITVSWDNTIKFWALDTGRVTMEANGHDSTNDYFTNLAVGPNIVAATSSTDGCIRLWDSRCEKPLISTIQAHSDIATTVAFVDENLVLSGSDDRTVKVWDRRVMGRNPRNTIRCSAGVNRLSVSPVTSHLAIPTDDRRVKLCDTWGKHLYGRLRSEEKNGHKYMVSSAAWSMDESVIFTASFDRTVIAWAAPDGAAPTKTGTALAS